MTSALFTPLNLKDLTLENRIVISPMCQYSAVEGSATDWHRSHLGTLTQSGAALMLIEATAVEALGRITYSDLGLYSDENERALGAVLDGVRRHSSMPIGVQLAHAGRKASSDLPWQGGQPLPPRDPNGWQTVGPSAIAVKETAHPPIALDRAAMTRIRDAFVASTRRADRLGLAAIELHFAHGYLMHQFMSPLSNHRTDEYGGSLRNRLRYPLEVFEAVRQAWPDKPLGVRVSATDWITGAWDLEQTTEFAREIHDRGCDWIDVSSGGIAPSQDIPVGPGYQLPLARGIRQATGMCTSTVGLITDPRQAEQAIGIGDADLVTLGRAILWDPRWPWHAAETLGARLTASPQYWRAVPHGAPAIFKGANTDGTSATGQRS